jgi:hypothetical protein
MILALLAGIALSQAQPGGADIVVTAPRQHDAATIRSFVRDASPVVAGQVARFNDPICPVVFGLPTDYGARIIRRIRAVATSAGRTAAPEGCAPNVTLLFANNSRSAVQELQRLRPRLFYGLENEEIRRLLDANPTPVRAWTLNETRDEDGSDHHASSAEQQRSGGDNSDNVLRVRSSSIINLASQQVITQSIVVVEEQATIGKTLDQLADYTAMRAIAGARPGGAAMRGNSILSLFEAGPEAPRSLTALDLAYLRALGQIRGNQRSTSQVARLGQLIDAALAGSR